MTAPNIAPLGALTWESAAERNRRLKLWRRAVLAVFGGQSRCVRLAWVLTDLFNVKMGYCFATNGSLAEETAMAANKVQETLATLEKGRAIVRTWITHPSGRKQRAIYPAKAIIPTPAVGVGGDPQQPGVHNLRSKRPRLPRTEWERARLAAEIRERGQSRAEASRPAPVATVEGCPSTEPTREPVPHTTPEPAAKAGPAYNGRGGRARYALAQKQ